MLATTMRGAYLPGNSTVELRTLPVPQPGHGQVLLAMKASSICGSDIRAIYRAHLGEGAERYQGVVAGHEPAGQVVAVGPGCREARPGDRVAVYHISGCGQCEDCRMGYQISCHGLGRAAYGWQRDGGHADFMLAEERDLVRLPDSLSYLDGALVACGYGTAFEALKRIRLSGLDTLLVTGLGPVGLAALQIARGFGVRRTIGVDLAPARLRLAADLGFIDHVLPFDDRVEDAVLRLTGGHGVQASLDATGAAPARRLALRCLRPRGRCVLVGEGGTMEFAPSPELIHKQVELHGSWVTSLPHMQELVDTLDSWRIRPEAIVTHRFGLDEAAEAYRVMDAGQCGKVAIVWP